MRHLLALALFAATACAPQASTAAPAPSPDQRAMAVLKATPLADGHNDWPGALRGAYGAQGALTADLNADPGLRKPPSDTSIPLLKQGRLGIQLWSNYVSASLSGDDAINTTLEQIAITRSFADRYPESFALVGTADEAVAAWKSGRIAGLLALEGAHQVNDDIATLQKMYSIGVRAMTLAHSKPTRLFDSSTAPPVHNGMAPGGAAMIAEMNRLGMLVDLSHVSPAVMSQVLDVTKSPVVFTHSSAKALTNVPRNVPDDILKRLPQNGGIVMVTFVPPFVNQARADWETARTAEKTAAGDGPEADARLKAWETANPRPVTTLAMVADHIDYVARTAGHDHVGIGSDFDGVPDTPVGLDNVSTYPALFAELARRGWSDENLRKLAGENFLRVLRANEAVAAGLAK